LLFLYIHNFSVETGPVLLENNLKESRKVRYPRLFQPGKIGKMEVKNRIVMTPMITETADKGGYVSQRTIDYYSERAKGGVGLIVVEASCVQSPVGRGFEPQIDVDDDKFIPGLTHLADGINKNGARSCIQLYHSGPAAHDYITGMKPLGPSPVSYEPVYQPTQEITREQMEKAKQCFVDAAKRWASIRCCCIPAINTSWQASCLLSGTNAKMSTGETSRTEHATPLKC